MQTKGFTLVELIVVITILAILGTIAFISLQGYGAEARNSKVTSDLRNLVSAIETDRTRNSTTLASILWTGTSTNNEIAASEEVGSGTLISSLASDGYWVADVNFAAINQNGADFKDPNANDAEYLYAYVSGTNSNGDTFGYYQLAGQILDNEVPKVRINGNYVAVLSEDAAGLMKAATGTEALENDDDGTLR